MIKRFTIIKYDNNVIIKFNNNKWCMYSVLGVQWLYTCHSYIRTNYYDIIFLRILPLYSSISTLIYWFT